MLKVFIYVKLHFKKLRKLWNSSILAISVLYMNSETSR